MTLRDLARFGMLFTPSRSLVADAVVIDGEHLRRIQSAPALRRPSGGDLPAYASAAFGGSSLPPASRQWNFVTEDGDLFKSGFGGQGLYISPTRDLVVAFAGTPRQDGSVNQLRWLGRRLALAIG